MDSYITTEIVLLRHAEVDAPKAIYGSLSDPKCKKAQLKKVPKANKNSYYKIFSSPMVRTCETAKSSLGEIPDTAQELKEFSFGIIDGLPFTEYTAEHQKIITDLESKGSIPGGESINDFSKRVLDFKNKILEKDLASKEGKKWLLITHGGVIGVLLSEVLKMNLFDVMKIIPAMNSRFTIIKYWQNLDNSENSEIFSRIITINSPTDTIFA